MTLQVSQELVGELKTIIIEGDRWKRMVIVIHKDDNVTIDYADESQDTNKLRLTLSPGSSQK